MNHIVMAAFEPTAPVGGAVPIFGAFRAGSDGGEEFPVQIQVEG